MCVGQAVAGVWPLAQVVSDQSVLRAIVEYSSVYRRYLKADPAALGSGARDTGVGNEAGSRGSRATRGRAHAGRGTRVTRSGVRVARNPRCGRNKPLALLPRDARHRAEVAAYRLLGLGYSWFVVFPKV